MRPPRPYAKSAFSLVELSIVLVILGLLVGGVLAGQSLIRAAELRAVTSEYSRYATAMQTFRDKYFALPGDMPNATSFWGDQATGTSSCASAATADGTPGTCNGDGNGDIGSSINNTLEGYRAWQHLSMAGIIEGSYTGYAGSPQFTQRNINIPASKISGGWQILYRSTGSSNEIYGYTGNLFLLGAEVFPSQFGSVVKSEEAWNIDTKIDDGMPGKGRFMAGSDSTGCVSPNSADTGASGAANTNATYNLASSSIRCRLWFKIL